MRLASSARIEEVVRGSRRVREGCEAVADELVREATSIAQSEAFDSGEYAAKIDRIPTRQPGALVRARDRKSNWIERGTGIYGPRRKVIKPKRGDFLVFRIPKGAPRASMSGDRKPGDLVFAREVRGRKPTHTMERAARKVASRPGRRWRPGPLAS